MAEKTIQGATIFFGWVAMIVPLLVALPHARRSKGRASGRAPILRSWPAMTISTLLLIALGFSLWKPIPLGLSGLVSLTVSILGALLYFPGVGSYLWGLFTIRSQFGTSDLFGAELYKDHKLVTSGPYTIIRQPMYAGILLAAIGALLIFRTWAMLLLAPMALVVIPRAEREEKLLEEEFGETWKTYATRTKRWWPFK